jgi:hypothetical protein
MIRVVVNSPMKCGSTFVSRVLARYFEIPDYQAFLGWGWQDHLLSPAVVTQSPTSCVLQAHLKPTRPNVECIKQYDLRLIFLWRNLGDVVVSLVDHICKIRSEQPMLYIPGTDWFLAKTVEERYATVIRGTIPWCIAFYIGWHKEMKRQAPRFYLYERMVNDPEEFFIEGIRSLQRAGVERSRLRMVLDECKRDAIRLNVGEHGRSTKLLSTGNKILLEELIREFGQDAAGCLLGELPWRSTLD